MTHRRAAPAAFASIIALSAAAVAGGQDAQLPILNEVQRLRAEVSKLRGIEWQAEVRVGVKTPDQIRAMVLGEFETEAPAEEMLAQEKVIKAFGLIPRDFDLRAKTVDFLAEHIAGYYDHEKKELFVVDSAGAKGGPAGGAGEMERRLMEEVAMAHELHHALQDQNYDLNRWFEVLDGQDDRIQGFKSLVEGEAQIVGMRFLFKKMGNPDMDIAQFNRMQDMMMGMSPEGKELQKIPPFILENMMFPYTQGAEFVQAMQKKHGWARIGQAFDDPPMSTEQILHPDKYLGATRDEPVELALPGGFARALGKGTKELYENTLGEFNLQLLLRAHGASKGDAARAAAGWDGDRFAGLETADERVVVIWLSTWDSEAEATEFEAAYRKALKGSGHLERRGTEVLWVTGATGEELPKLVRKAFAAVKVEEKLAPLPGMFGRPPRSDFTNEPAPAGSDTQGASKPGATKPTSPEAAPSALESSLARFDDLGVTLAPPAGFTITPEPVPQVQSMGGQHLEAAGGVHARLVRLPVPGPAAADQILTLVKQEQKDAKISSPVDGTTLGRPSKTFSVTGTIPGQQVQTTTRVTVLDLGPDALAVGVTLPSSAGTGEQQLAAVLAGLWVDGVRTPNVAQVTWGEVSLDVLEGFLGRAGQGPIRGTFERPDGAKVQVVVVDAADSLEDGARALEAQLPLVLADYTRRAGGFVVRGGLKAHELEFDAAGRRVRQLTLVRDGKRISVACSASAAKFEACLPAFGRALASVRLEGAARPERKAY